MKQKEHLIWSPYRHGIFIIGFLLLCLFFDFILSIKHTEHRVILGFYANVIGTIWGEKWFFHSFFKRLTVRYPDLQNEIEKAAKPLVSFRHFFMGTLMGWGWRLRNSIDKEAVMLNLMKDKPAAEQINHEWRGGLRWCNYGLLGMLFHLFALMVFSYWI